MTKLDGNDRWQNKMLLTEHVEQYTQQEEEPARRMITVEERTMVRDLILLPYIETMVDKSLQDIELSSNILKRAYLMAGQAIQRRIMQDTFELRKELKQRNIKVVADEQEEFLVYHKIFCRGRQERFGLTRDVIRTEISLRLTRYTGEIGVILNNQMSKPRQ